MSSLDTNISTFNLLATPTTVNIAAGASVALTIGHASAAATFPGGISIPTGKTLSGAGAINISGNITGAAGSFTTGAFSGLLDVSVGGLKITLYTPPASASTGTAGTVAYDSSYFYVATATDTWKRAAIAAW